MPVFAKYFGISPLSKLVDTLPKFILYSGHSETLYPLFTGFGKYIVNRPAPGSAIFIEFFQESGNLFVEAFFKETATAPKTSFDIYGASTVSLQTFQRFIR